MDKYRLSPGGYAVVGDGVEIRFEDPMWAKVVCNFMNGKINAAKGMMGEWEKKRMMWEKSQ